MEPENPQKKPIVETFANDMAKVLENDHEGLIKKIIEGEEEREQEKTTPESRRNNRIFLITSVGLVFLGAVLLIYFWAGHRGGITEIAPQFTPLIFADRSTFVEKGELKRKEVIQSILNQTEVTDLKPNGIVAAYLTNGGGNVGLRQFLSLVKLNLEPEANPVLVSDSFMMGRVNVPQIVPGGSEGFFILLKTRSAVDIFDSLRTWEEKMFYDLHGFFGVNSTGDNAYLLTKDFEDGVVENKNARVLLNREGNLVFMYVFADNESVVITDSYEAVREIILRLGAKQIKE